MGLAGPRNRRKLDHDPNNTKWTRDETTFGQKILRAQGWAPGKFLGAQDTPHAQLHSAASLAPIKINLKDDTLGLGAKIRQKQSDECTGLDAFKDLLGRLNGKSEETLDKERQVRSEIKTNLFVERKYGPMRFVSGGLLVGDQIKMAELVDNKSASTPIKDEPTSESSDAEPIKKAKKEKKEKKSKKRKAIDSEETDTSDRKRENKRKKRSKADEELEIDDIEVEKSTKKKKDKKEKKSKHSEKALEDEMDAEPVESEAKPKKNKKSKDAPQQESLSSSIETPKGTTSEKAKKKDKKREKRRKEADSTEAGIIIATTVSSTTTSTATPQDSGSSTPISTGTSIPLALSARHRSRARHIAAKKMAFSDTTALNQIFMIKPV
ncbi:hypothetical protein O1611_g124 [Lasiodiplodia mahajangana]|uniref:Uncharacterized protein n=1 Tax=Lasiodiplodia mahajangana TaxID=1108764 RepID=A0ACC2K1F2_9PEZI|nr:hypothetical protein O1611_g124 [Lasiodiplodia mahajangana]